MPITFYTTRLNKRLYKGMMRNVLLNLGVDVHGFMKEWDIRIWGMEQNNSEFYEHVVTAMGGKINTNMPSGVTGKYQIDLYLHDDTNDLKHRENFDRVQHEICHAVLFGTPHFVHGVHDNVSNRFTIKFWYWNKVFWKRFQGTVIDIRRFL